MTSPIFSYEFFPPRTQLGERRFWRTVGRLEAQDVAFFSITYGALGSAPVSYTHLTLPTICSV